MYTMLLAGLLLLTPGASFTGLVMTVDDCRSLTVMLADERRVLLRLDGIECDTRATVVGQQAWRELRSQTLGREVDVSLHSLEPGGRWRARVSLDDVDLATHLVGARLAWRALGSEPETAVAPEAGVDQPARAAPAARARGARLHGNENSHVYHEPFCRYYHCQHCVVEFDNAAQARAAGFRPGGCCHRRD